MYCRELSALEKMATGMTHFGSISANDLTQTTNNTDQSFNLLPIPTGAVVEKIEAELIVAFKDQSDTGFNSVTIDIGDTGSATRWKTAQDVNANGTPITNVYSNTAVGPYAASQYVTVNFNSQSAKALNDVDLGEVQFLIKVADYRAVHAGQPATVITK